MFGNRTENPKMVAISTFLILISLSLFAFMALSDYLNEESAIDLPTDVQKTGLFTTAKTATKNHQKVFKFAHIEFSSDFETGNIQQVISLNKQHYSLQIEEDPFNSKASGIPKKNWFHFEVTSRLSKQTSLKFSIHNLEKNWSIWTHGCALAFKSNLATNDTWQLFNATEFKLIMKTKGLVIEFIYDLNENEIVNFALTFPYSYSQLSKYLNETQDYFRNQTSVFFHRETLIKSNLGNNVELLTISGDNNLTSSFIPKMKHLFPERDKATKDTWTPLFQKSKRVFVVSARVHPSESASSYMLEGFIDFFKSRSVEMTDFLKHNVVYVIPMLNPDGVVSGFTRCDANGFNLNARYKEADLNTPSIYALKKFIRYQNHRNKVRIFLDLHSHITKRGFFMFGNPLRKKNYLQILEFPFLLKKRQKKFSIKQSKFGSNKHEESTSRKEIYKYTKLRGIYTIEANYWGNRENKSKLKSNKLIQNNLRKVTNFNGFSDIKSFKVFGKNIGQSMLDFYLNAEKPILGKKKKLMEKIDKFYESKNVNKKKSKKLVGKSVFVAGKNATGSF